MARGLGCYSQVAPKQQQTKKSTIPSVFCKRHWYLGGAGIAWITLSSLCISGTVTCVQVKAANKIHACCNQRLAENGELDPPHTIWQCVHTNRVMWVNRAGCCNPQDINISQYSRYDINAPPGLTCAASANCVTDMRLFKNQYSDQTPATAAFARIHTAEGRYIWAMEPTLEGE